MAGEPHGDAFLNAVFHGDRFDGGRLPLAVASDLAALNDLLVKLAREIFLDDNPERKRLPKGFRATTELWISNVEDGSASTVLERPITDNHQLDAFDPFVQARDLALLTIDAAGKGEELPDRFPSWAKAGFNKIGRNLSENEVLDLSVPGGNVVNFDRRVRSLLVQQVVPIEDDFFAVGPMQAVNSETKTFAIAAPDGMVNGTYPEEYDPDFRDALAKGVLSAFYLDGALPFRVEGTATFRDGEMLSFDAESIGQIEFPEGPGTFENAISRVKVLLALEAGWLDGDGESISQDEAEFMLGVMAALADLEAPCPLLFPTEAGHVRAEWLTDGHEVIWECDRSGEHFVLVRALGQADGVEHSIPVNLSSYDVAEKIVSLGVFGPEEDTGGE